MEPLSLHDIFHAGQKDIPISRSENLFAQLEERELSSRESEIIARRIGLQRSLLATYERREEERKVRAVAKVLPQLSEADIKHLLSQFGSEEEAVAAFVADPDILAERAAGASATSVFSKEIGTVAAKSGRLAGGGTSQTPLPVPPQHCRKKRRSARACVQPAAAWLRQCRDSAGILSLHQQEDDPEQRGRVPDSSNLQPETGPQSSEQSLGRRADGGANVDESSPAAVGMEASELPVATLPAAQAGRQLRGEIRVAGNNSSEPESDSSKCWQGGAQCRDAPDDSPIVAPPSLLVSKRPKRAAALGVSVLLKAMREPEQALNRDEALRGRRRKSRIEAIAKDISTLETWSDGQACDGNPPERKPSLGRVKKCSSKAVQLLAAGSLRLEPGWSNRGYIFPDGFQSVTAFRSSVHFGRNCQHVCSIIGKGGCFWPLPTFQIVADDRPEPVVAKSATGAWTGVLKRINAAILKRRKAGEDLPPPPGTAIPGPEFFGLTNPDIVAAVEQLDPGRACAAYWQGKQERLAYIRTHGDVPQPRGVTNSRRGATKLRAQAQSAETSEEEWEGSDASGGVDGDEMEASFNRWSGVDRAERLRRRRGSSAEGEVGEEQGEVLVDAVDPITLGKMWRPAMSPAGHVMGMATWAAVLAERGRCPFTQRPLSKGELVLLTPANIERYRSRLITR